MLVPSPAKINLFLRVGPVGADGYHPLVTWMVRVGLFDNLILSANNAGRLSVACEHPAVSQDGDNLVLRAGRALREFCAVRDATGQATPPMAATVSGESTARNLGVHVSIDKRIPVGGGMGGGSSNAASVLLALNDLWQLRLSEVELASVGATVGSDVPFFLLGGRVGSALCTGRGEHVRPVAPPTATSAVLLLPEVVVSTRDVFRVFDELDRSGTSRPKFVDDPMVLGHPDFLNQSTVELLGSLFNDLEEPTYHICPALRTLRSDAEQIIARPVRMSGSGSTHFSLYDDPADATDAAEQLRKELGVKTCVCPVCPV